MKQDACAPGVAKSGCRASGEVGSGDRVRFSGRVTRVAISLAVVFVALLEIGCDRYRHGLRPGTLSEVEVPTLTIFVVDPDHWKLAIGNEAKDGTCLEMGASRHDRRRRADGHAGRSHQRSDEGLVWTRRSY